MNFKEKSKSRVNNQQGQGMIEYLIIISLIAVASIAIIRGLQGNLTAQFAKVTNAIGGYSGNSETEQANQNDFRKRDMGDFFDNSVAPNRTGGNNRR